MQVEQARLLALHHCSHVHHPICQLNRFRSYDSCFGDADTRTLQLLELDMIGIRAQATPNPGPKAAKP